MHPKAFRLALATSVVACAHPAADQKIVAQTKAVFARHPTLSWYRLPGSDYSVLMPPGVKPGEKDRTIPKGEVKIRFAQAMPQGASGNYFVSCAQFPPGVLDPRAATALLDEVEQSTLQEMGAELTSSKDIGIDGLPGREFTAHKGTEGKILGRIAVAPERIYTLIGTYTSQEPPQPVRDFVGSLSRNGSEPRSSTSLP